MFFFGQKHARGEGCCRDVSNNLPSYIEAAQFRGDWFLPSRWFFGPCSWNICWENGFESYTKKNWLVVEPTHLKIWSSNWVHLPQLGVKIKHIWVPNSPENAEVFPLWIPRFLLVFLSYLWWPVPTRELLSKEVLNISWKEGPKFGSGSLGRHFLLKKPSIFRCELLWVSGRVVGQVSLAGAFNPHIVRIS